MIFISSVTIAALKRVHLKYYVLHCNHMDDVDYRINSEITEARLKEERRKQAGVTFPSAREQEHILIIRFNISTSKPKDKEIEIIRTALRRLCSYFEAIENGSIKLDKSTQDGEIEFSTLADFNFSVTLGLGVGFFDKLNISSKYRPKKLKEMPNNIGLGDLQPYSLLQTDFLIQLGSNSEYVNRWIFQNSSARISQRKSAMTNQNLNQRINKPDLDDHPNEIFSTVNEWATVTDIHAGFQRFDGRNLMGFKDGTSNPKRLSNDVVWLTPGDEGKELIDGTYMVFQKIEHDLERWRNMTVERQEQWIGRSKGTGLLLGTLPKEQDKKLEKDLHSDNPVVRAQALRTWQKLYNEQRDPDRKFFDNGLKQYENIQIECPIWSHVRKANPREADGAAKSLMFRRGYLFMDAVSQGIFNSGLLFICFQKDIGRGFEYVKKNFLNNKDFPVPAPRKNFSSSELGYRRLHGRFTEGEIKRGVYGHQLSSDYMEKMTDEPDTQNTGREGLSGPSELGIYPDDQYPVTLSLGGGYYFVPPIPKRKFSDICEQFFD